MKRIFSKRTAFTLLEALTAATITTVVIGSVFATTVALQRSFLGNRSYTKSINDSNRVLDYIARDLRNASAVSRRTDNVSKTFKVGEFHIAANDELCVFISNFYVSNNPDNSKGSDFKSPFFSRKNLASGETYFAYDTLVRIDGITRVPQYKGPSGSRPDTLEVRYVKRARSTSDPVICFFRTEIENGTIKQTEEIAEKVEGLNIKVTGKSLYYMRLESSFSSRWTGEKYREASRQFITVGLENYRTDWRL